MRRSGKPLAISSLFSMLTTCAWKAVSSGKPNVWNRQRLSLPPSVSVIIAVKNGDQYLEESLRSVLAQDHRPCEILVLDDESTDETESIARQFAKYGVRFIGNHPPLGIAGSRNLGI